MIRRSRRTWKAGLVPFCLDRALILALGLLVWSAGAVPAQESCVPRTCELHFDGRGPLGGSGEPVVELGSPEPDLRILQEESDSVAPDTRGERFTRTVGPAVGGSALGLVGGALAGASVLSIGGEDGYGAFVIGATVGAVTGATLLSSAAAYMLGAPDDGKSFAHSMGGAVLGAIPGWLAADVASRLWDGNGEFVFTAGFAVGQGAMTALFTAW